MKLAYYIKKAALKGDPRVEGLLSQLRDGGCELYDLLAAGAFLPETDALLSFGGDGTFLTAARVAVPAGIPIVGVNFGRLGFLSENKPEDVARALLSGEFEVEERSLLQVDMDCEAPAGWTPFALNEACVSRISPSMLGIDVKVGESALPTYWADGLLVSTSSGSTAYSLSVGGPICTPDTSVSIIAPIAPHNLNVRPLIVPETTAITIVPKSRDGRCSLSLDNRNCIIPTGTVVRIGQAPFKLKRLKLGQSNFINALRSRLLWGEDVRNSGEQY